MSNLSHIRALVEATAGDSVTLPKAWALELLGDARDNGGEVAIDKTADEVGTMVGRAASTVRAWAAEGRFPGSYRLGKQLRFPPASITAFQEGQRLQGKTIDLSSWRKPRAS